MLIRRANTSDIGFLERMLFEAYFWDPAISRPALSACRARPEFAMHLADWGRRGDCALVAEDAGEPLGAAWYRLWTPEHHAHGFVDASTPEVGLGVAGAYRSRGIGRALLQELMATARRENMSALSLSVDPANRARRLYETAGFTKVGDSGSSWTYLRHL